MPSKIILFIESLFIGFVMAAPVGPVAMLSLRRVMRSGWRAGFITGLGVAAVDAIFGLISSLGMNSVSDFLNNWVQIIRLLGGVLLLIIGWQIYQSRPKNSAEDNSDKKSWRHFLSAFLLAATNPLAIFSFAAVYISLGLSQEVKGGLIQVGLFTVGIFLGSSLWWALLSFIAVKLKSKITAQSFAWVNKGCGITIFFFGVVTLVVFLLHMQFIKALF